MALYADRVQESTSTAGTGAITLSGTAPTGYQTFATAFGSTPLTVAYCIADQVTGNWEVGTGVFNGTTNLTRVTILSSSAAGAAVSFAAGTKIVFCTAPSKYLDFSSPPSIGDVLAAAGAFTTLSSSGQANLGGSVSAPALRAAVTASSVNYAQIVGSVASNAVGPTLSAQGSDTNIPLTITSKGTGSVFLSTPNGSVINAQDRGGTVDSPWIFRAGAAGVSPSVLTSGVSARFQTGDASNFGFFTNAGTSGAQGGFRQFSISHAASAVNYFQASGSATTAAPTLSAQGSDANISVTLTPKGTGNIIASSPILLPGYTVATLPAAGTVGRIAYVTDATAPTYNGTLIGGGSVKVIVFDNGSAWTSQ